jgi:polyphosphate kinase
MNQLEDHDVCRALYKASQAGVPIDLIIRGFCILRPGVPELSPTIRVISVVGRFLEHSRIFYFRNAAEQEADGQFFIGSADWMHRNLEERIEAITPIESEPLRVRLLSILQTLLDDQRCAWDMHADGSYRQRSPAADASEPATLGTHQVLMEHARRTSGR